MLAAFFSIACEDDALVTARDKDAAPRAEAGALTLDAGLLEDAAAPEDAAPAPEDAAPASEDAAAPDAEPAPDATPAPDAAPAPDASEPPPATEPVYLNTSNSLYSYDPATQRSTRVGTFTRNGTPMSGMIDIAIDARGDLIGGNLAREVFRIDPTSAAVTKLFDLRQTPVGLTFLSSGELVVAGDRVELIDIGSGAITRVLVDDPTLHTSGDIVALPDGFLYWAVVSGGDGLVKIDPATGGTTMLGAIGESEIYGLGWASGDLIGFGGTLSGGAFVIDPTTGTKTRSITLPGIWYGATTNPVRW